MPFSKITQTAHYVPEQVVTNDDLAQIMDTSDEWISSRTGIKRRHISRNENTSDLAIKVAEQLLAKAGLKAEELDFIIVATMTPDSMMPSTAARVQGRLGAHKAFAFDMTAACSGFVFALATADKLITSGAYQRGIVIGAEVLSKAIDWSDRTTAVLFGDGAGGVLLETSDQPHVLAEHLATDGSLQGLDYGASPLHSPYSADSEPINTLLQMDGRAIFDFTIRTVSKSIRQLIDDATIAADEIDYYLLHQANIRILDKMAKKITLPRERFLANMMEYGNTSAASIPILLSENVIAGKILLDGTQTVLISGFGGGLTWGSLIVKI